MMDWLLLQGRCLKQRESLYENSLAGTQRPVKQEDFPPLSWLQSAYRGQKFQRRQMAEIHR